MDVSNVNNSGWFRYYNYNELFRESASYVGVFPSRWSDTIIYNNSDGVVSDKGAMKTI